MKDNSPFFFNSSRAKYRFLKAETSLKYSQIEEHTCSGASHQTVTGFESRGNNETLKTTGNSQRLNDTALKKYSKYFACCFDVVFFFFFEVVHP